MSSTYQRLLLGARNALDRLAGKEIALKGGISTPGVVRVGDTVRRPMNANSPFVHDLLQDLERRGCDVVPRFLGIDEKGRTILTYLPGTINNQPGGREREQWRAAARLLRRFHDATAASDLRGDSEIIIHGDPTPGNFVLREGMPVALIDFDGARPGKREEDVGYAAWMWLHIGNRKVAPEDQGSDLMDFFHAYDATATWDPLGAVLSAQKALLARIPSGLKWSIVKLWVKGCLSRTYRHRERIAATCRLPPAT